MAKINKLQKSGVTIYPATIPQAVIDSETGKTQKEVNDDLVQLESDLSEYAKKTSDSFQFIAKGYIDSNPKFKSDNSSISIVQKVVTSKKYKITVKTGVTLLSKHCLFTSDIEGQLPVDGRFGLTHGETVITAPIGAEYLFVCVSFIGNGNLEDYDVIEYTQYLERNDTNIEQLRIDVDDVSDVANNAIVTVEKVAESIDGAILVKNLYDYDKVGVVTGVISTSGSLITTGFSTGLIPVLPNHFYNLGNRSEVAIQSIRCLDADGVTKSKVRVASTGVESTNYYYLPSEDDSHTVSNGQFKTSPTARYIQISLTKIDASEILDNYKIMLEDVGEVYNSEFIPSNYMPAHSIVIDERLEYPVKPLFDRVEKIESLLIPKVLLIGSSHGMNTIGQFPILAYNSGMDIVCANTYQGSLNLSEVASYCTNGTVFGGSYKKFYDGVWHTESSKTMLQMLQDEKWDVISLQRSASYDTTWTEQQAEDFETILSFITANCDYTPKIVFNSGFADRYSIEERAEQQADTSLISSTAENLKTEYGIDIIPMADALQKLRNNDTIASLGSDPYGMLACDGQHLDQGIGMYASGCICFNFFLGHLNKSILSCKYLPTIADMTPFWYDPEKFTAIEEQYAKMIRKIVNQYFCE